MSTTLELFPFQEESVDYLADQPTAVIADDMGLGKTRQAMERDRRFRARAQSYVTRPHTLIVCPKSAIAVWQNHYAQLLPAMRVYATPADTAARRKLFMEAVRTGNYHIYIVHYDAVRKLVGGSDQAVSGLEKILFFHIIADEAHRIKTHNSKLTKSFKQLRSIYKTALTGTPADNKPDDFWSILNWLHPQDYRSYWKFYDQHIIYTLSYPGSYRVMVGVADVDELLENIRPYYVRRMKDDVLTDLPEKYYSTIEVELTPLQKRAYNQLKEDFVTWLEQQDKEEVLAAPVVVARLIRLQQFASAYGQIETTVTTRLNEIGEQEEVEERHLRLSEPSSKLDALMELLRDNPDEKFVVFSTSKQVVVLLAKRLADAGIDHVTLTGDTPGAERGTVAERFQSGPARVFAATIRAGGESITLTAASRVVFLDRDWNPSKNAQAEDRCRRIGQKNAVQVIDIRARDTIDIEKASQVERKAEWLRAIVGDAKVS